jgi:opacity protein-like surface antigen
LSVPSVEVGGGYTFRSFAYPPAEGEDGGVLNFPRVSMNGWDANAALNLNKWIGVAADVDGTRSSAPDEISGNDITWVYTVMAGPRVYPIGHHKLTPFAQVLFGHSYLTITLPSETDCAPYCKFTDGSFAWSAGGGLDWAVSRHFVVRLGEVDYERTAFFKISSAPLLSDANNNFKVKAGVILRF